MSLLKEPAAEEGQYVTKIHIDEKMERRGKVVWGEGCNVRRMGSGFCRSFRRSLDNRSRERPKTLIRKLLAIFHDASEIVMAIFYCLVFSIYLFARIHTRDELSSSK